MRVAIHCELEPDFLEADFPVIPTTGDIVIADSYGEFVVDSVAWFMNEDMVGEPRLVLVPMGD